jgi:hypothetical protein
MKPKTTKLRYRDLLTGLQFKTDQPIIRVFACTRCAIPVAEAMTLPSRASTKSVVINVDGTKHSRSCSANRSVIRVHRRTAVSVRTQREGLPPDVDISRD